MHHCGAVANGEGGLVVVVLVVVVEVVVGGTVVDVLVLVVLVGATVLVVVEVTVVVAASPAHEATRRATTHVTIHRSQRSMTRRLRPFDHALRGHPTPIGATECFARPLGDRRGVDRL